MEETLFEDLPLSRKSVVPGAGFFAPDRDGPPEERIALLERADTVVVADGDADGLGCAALVREMEGDPAPEPAVLDPEESEESAAYEGRVVVVAASPHWFPEAFEQIVEHAPAGVSVFVCDLCPDDEEDLDPLAPLVEHAADVHWFDHHQWDTTLADRVREAGVELAVGESDEECSTDVALRRLDYDFDPMYETLAAVTRDHDLWLREDPRSDDLADYAYWVSSETYVATVRTHGADLPEFALSYLESRRTEKRALVDLAVGRAEFHEIDGVTVAVTYGRCSQNEVCEALREQGSDAAVVVKPSGSASIRGTDAFERCHEVAGQVGGGGHPQAAGCKPDIYDDVLEYAHHWTTRGAVTKRVILDAFENLPPEEQEEDEGDDDESIERQV
jgi:oligoribonuclease NrnB/cAMP/cGMP phosphodiesterase (DHH superfamily)